MSPGKQKITRTQGWICLHYILGLSCIFRNDGKISVPIFRLSAEAKAALFKWVASDVKFCDGYVSNLSRCVDQQGHKFSGMKNHDCHVFMQRLLPFAFTELLPKNVHEALAGNK